MRFFLVSKFSNIKQIFHYKFFSKKGKNFFRTAKEFTERSLNIDKCPTETTIRIKKNKLENLKVNKSKKIILGIGSSGPTTKWGYKNYISLIKKLNDLGNFHFYLLKDLTIYFV